jgi:hypothetical protein
VRSFQRQTEQDQRNIYENTRLALSCTWHYFTIFRQQRTEESCISWSETISYCISWSETISYCISWSETISYDMRLPHISWIKCSYWLFVCLTCMCLLVWMSLFRILHYMS